MIRMVIKQNRHPCPLASNTSGHNRLDIMWMHIQHQHIKTNKSRHQRRNTLSSAHDRRHHSAPMPCPAKTLLCFWCGRLRYHNRRVDQCLAHHQPLNYPRVATSVIGFREHMPKTALTRMVSNRNIRLNPFNQQALQIGQLVMTCGVLPQYLSQKPGNVNGATKRGLFLHA